MTAKVKGVFVTPQRTAGRIWLSFPHNVTEYGGPTRPLCPQPPPPSCRRRRRCCAATNSTAVLPSPPSCHRRNHRRSFASAAAALPPPPPPHCHQAAAAATIAFVFIVVVVAVIITVSDAVAADAFKLFIVDCAAATKAALTPSCRRRRQAGCRRSADATATTAACYEIRVLWYLLTVLTYQSHLITLQSQKESHLIPSRIWTFHIIAYCGISIVSSQKLPDTLRINHASQSHRFESCQIVTLRLEISSLF
jgi:hypothetical protein